MNPQETLKGRVCLVTGASRTLGATIARVLAGYGAVVALNYWQSKAQAEALCEEIRASGGIAEPFQADVGDAEALTGLVEQVWERWGSLELLVNNVGHFTEAPFLELPLEEFDRILATNIRCTFVASQVAGKRMKERGRGQIINIAATDAFHRSHSAYGLAKEGVLHLTQAMALDLAPEVRVNAIAPDLIADNEDMSEAFVASAIGGTPLRRLVTRQEIAEMVALLTTPPFASMTGQTIVMDGGRSIPRLRFGD